MISGAFSVFCLQAGLAAAAAIVTITAVMVTILVVMLLHIDALTQTVEADVQVAAFLHRQAAAASTVPDLQATQASKLPAQALGFRAGDLAAKDALVYAAVQIGLALVD